MYRLTPLATRLICFLLCVTLTLSFASGGDGPTTGTITPGSIFTGIDGIRVDATRAGFEGELNVYLERVEDTEALVPLISGHPETAYYRIGASELFATDVSAPLRIRVPLPENAPTDNLLVGMLVPSENLLHQEHNLRDSWSFGPATYSPDTNEVVFTQGILNPEGLVFVIVSMQGTLP